MNQAINDDGRTAGRQDGISMASENGHLDVVKLLLGSEGINVNQARNVGATAL